MRIAVPLMFFVLLGVGGAVWLVGLHRRMALDRGIPYSMAHMTIMGIGAAPLSFLSLGYMHAAPLNFLMFVFVLPAYVIMTAIGLWFPELGWRALYGFVAGVVAVLAYDAMRLSLSYSQGGKDPIPHIGVMLFGSGAPWWVGYVWRTFGNGAGLGVTYAMLCPRKYYGPMSGLAFGTLVGLGMLVFLWSEPVAQTQLFKLTWQTVVNGFLGHWTYGATLGWMLRAARDRPPKPVRVHGRHARVY